jgi:hypothetical protein
VGSNFLAAIVQGSKNAHAVYYAAALAVDVYMYFAVLPFGCVNFTGKRMAVNIGAYFAINAEGYFVFRLIQYIIHLLRWFFEISCKTNTKILINGKTLSC